MRVSSMTLFDQSVAQMQRRQAELVETQRRMSLGTRLLSPSDDPVAAARVLLLDQGAATNEQYQRNRDTARNALGLQESVLVNVGNLLREVRTVVINAGNPTLTNNDRDALVTELRSRFQELMGLANSTDETGQYLFSGYQGSTQPFSGAAGAVQYAGDQGQRLIQVGATRQIPVSDSGVEVFMRLPTGNGRFVTEANAANTGTGVISPGAVTGTLTGDTYEVQFTSATAYDVVDVTTSTTVSTGNAYTSGGVISFGGMDFDIAGSPATGDRFSVAPSASQDVFATLADIITAVDTQGGSALGNTRLTNAVNSALSNFDHALDRVLTVRADIGSRLAEIDSLDALGEGIALQYSKTASGLRDLDYAAAIADLTRQQTVLQAAQKSFVATASQSLFDLI